MISAVLLSVLAQCSVKAEWLPDYEVLRLDDGTGFGSIERSLCSQIPIEVGGARFVPEHPAR